MLGIRTPSSKYASGMKLGDRFCNDVFILGSWP